MIHEKNPENIFASAGLSREISSFLDKIEQTEFERPFSAEIVQNLLIDGDVPSTHNARKDLMKRMAIDPDVKINRFSFSAALQELEKLNFVELGGRDPAAYRSITLLDRPDGTPQPRSE